MGRGSVERHLEMAQPTKNLATGLHSFLLDRLRQKLSFKATPWSKERLSMKAFVNAYLYTNQPTYIPIYPPKRPKQVALRIQKTVKKLFTGLHLLSH